MFEIKKQGNNGRKPLATLGNLKLACVELGIPDDKHTLRRASRAFDLYNSEKVEHVNDHTFNVKSQYRERLPYQVHITENGTSYCTCPDWMNYSGDMVLPDVHFHCKHSIAARIWLHHNGNGWRVRSHALGSKIVNDCGTSEAKALQEKLNGSNGTGDTKSPSHQLDRSDPFQESEQMDIEQIQGKRNGDLVHHLSNGEYIISYNGIMHLANKHGVTFTKHTVKSDAKRNGTVVAHARLGNNTRASGKPMNGSFITAVELAKRNAARQLLPLGEIKAMEKKAQLEGEFDWQVAKRKCLEIVPDFTFDILLNDLVRDGKLEQKHTSDYSRKEWLVIFDACKRDALRVSRLVESETETNGIDDDGVETHGEAARLRLCAPGDNTPSSDEQVTCCICGRTLTNKLSISRCVGPECFKKVGAQGAQFLRDDLSAPVCVQRTGRCDAQAGEVSDELIKASQLYQDEALQKRIVKSCLTLDAPLPVKVLRWLGNEYFGYKNRPILYYVCADGQLNRIDTAKRKLRHAIITRDTAETELDAHGLAQMSVDVADPSEPKAEVPDNADEFIAKCKQAEAEVEDTIEDVDDTPTNGDGKRKLQMDKKLNTWLIEADGTKKDFSCREICEQFDGNLVMRLRSGIDSGGDISTVELEN